MPTLGTIRRAVRMPLVYRNFTTAWYNRFMPYIESDRMVLYRLRKDVDLIAAPGPHDMKVINEIWLEREYDAPDFIPRSGWTVIDLGANKGYYAAWALTEAPEARVTCYEPDPRNYTSLRANLSRFDNNVKTHQCAVGSKAAPLALFRLAGRAGQATLSRTRALNFGTIVDQIDVDVVTFSSVTGGLDHVDLLKVDVEGAEYDIILGSEPEAFANVERIIVEIDDADPDNARGNAAAVVERLHELGFRLTQERRGLWFFRR